MSCYIESNVEDFHGGAVDKNSPTNAGSTGLIPDPGKIQMSQGN